jgi:DNA ligase (NAD+)
MEQTRQRRAIVLEDEIRGHDKCYWQDNFPIISDEVYDSKVNELLSIEPDNAYLKEVRTPKVSSTKKIKHQVPMLSLDKAYTYEDVIKFCQKVARSAKEVFKIMFKYDGVSGQLLDGVLATRGDGLIGEDITNKLPFMTILTRDMSGNLRGEILFTKSDFQKIKGVITRKSGADYKNERNAVGGILSRDDLPPRRILTFIDFEYTAMKFPLDVIIDMGLTGWTRIVESAKLSDYPTDGLVIKLDDELYGQSLGATSHHLKSAIAFKFANQYEWSVLREIEFSPGKHDITPVGKIDPIEITGVTVTSPSLHNWKNILDRDLCIGDEVKVERAGDVIPYISDSRPGKNREPIMIPMCPVCSCPLEYNEPQLQCTNDLCQGKLANRLADAVIRLGIDRLGKPTIQKMIDTYNVETVVDILMLSIYQLEKLPGFGKTSAKNLYDEISKVIQEGVYEWQYLAALNIPGIGRSLSKQLLENRTLQELSQMSPSQLEKLEGIGPERANAIIRGIQNNYILLGMLKLTLKTKKEEPKQEDLVKVCFTGKFDEPKSYYYDFLNKTGGYDIKNSVTGIDVLVVADPTKNSSKQKAAEKKGIKIMGINEFMLFNSLKKNQED